jgi:hypothetical protein
MVYLCAADDAGLENDKGARRAYSKAVAARLLNAPDTQAADFTSIFFVCAGTGSSWFLSCSDS